MVITKKNKAILGLLTLFSVGQSLTMQQRVFPTAAQIALRMKSGFSVPSVKLRGVAGVIGASGVIWKSSKSTSAQLVSHVVVKDLSLPLLQQVTQFVLDHKSVGVGLGVVAAGLVLAGCGYWYGKKTSAAQFESVQSNLLQELSIRREQSEERMQSIIELQTQISHEREAIRNQTRELGAASENSQRVESMERAHRQIIAHYQTIICQKDTLLHEKDAKVIACIDQLLSLVEQYIALARDIDSAQIAEAENFLEKTAGLYQELLPSLHNMAQSSKNTPMREKLTHAISLVKQLQQYSALTPGVVSYEKEVFPDCGTYHAKEQSRDGLLAKLQECKQILLTMKEGLQGTVCIICREAAGAELGELVALPCAHNHGRVIHQECLDGLMQQHHACPMCRELLQRTAPIEQATHEVVHVLAEDGNGYEEIPFPIVPNDYSMAAPTAEDAQ